MDKEELTDKYYKEDLCIDCGRCKLYHALFTQGQCEYYNQWCEQKEKIKNLEKEIKKYERHILNLTDEKVEKTINKMKAKDYLLIEKIVEDIRTEIVDYSIHYSSSVDVLMCLDAFLDKILEENK